MAKSVNFGLIYGQGAFGLAENLGISRTEAKEIIDNYFIQFPGIKDYMDETIEFARTNGYVATLLGRRRYIRDINSANQTVRGFAERNAINAPIQGTPADMIKIAKEEIEHFEMVHELIKSKGLEFGRERKDDYVGELYKFMKKGASRTVAFVDRLLFSAMIEARSCERFKVLSENIQDKELSKFYHDLMVSEEGHYTTFLGYARK